MAEPGELDDAAATAWAALGSARSADPYDWDPATEAATPPMEDPALVAIGSLTAEASNGGGRNGSGRDGPGRDGSARDAESPFEAGPLAVGQAEAVSAPVRRRKPRAARAPGERIAGAKSRRVTAAGAPSPATSRSPAPPRRTAAPTPVPASCPYCASLLEPAPDASRRCGRCRQRIVVRRLDGRAVYLTEAAVSVFEAERQRVASTGRWTRERARWLRLATAAGAPAGRIQRLTSAVLSEEVIEAARGLYLATVEKAFRAAKREHRWEQAATIRREQALALYRAVRSPVPPPDEVLALHREAAATDLRGLSDISRDAALVAAPCCEACAADVGRTFRISRELQGARLPHAGCPRGLCRCRWDLADRERSLVARYLRRRSRT